MVRGNWQKRVETADARRKEAKQRKHRSEEKRIFKGQAQEMLALLDRQMDAIRRSSSASEGGSSTSCCWKLHLWVDSLPSESPPFLDSMMMEEDEGGTGKSNRRARSSSIEDSNAATNKGKKKGRGRSGSFQQDGKKVHPRSKEAETEKEESRSAGPVLCRSQFFHGKCLNVQKPGKKGGCRCAHYNNKQLKTLAAVLVDNKQKGGPKTEKDAIAQAEEACEANTPQEITESDPGGMEVVYYLLLPIPSNIGTVVEDGDESSRNTISDLTTEKLASNQIGIGSIVYLAISSPSRNILLYDRNREGLVIQEFTVDVLGSSGDGSTGESIEADDKLNAEHLPVSILEHIFQYLEAPAVASAAQVCTSWHREIRHASPNLWRHLLNQRDWPFPLDALEGHLIDGSLQDQEQAASASGILRDEFIKHYSVLRDMKALQQAMTGLLTRRPTEEREMSFQAFSTRRGAPQAPNNCVTVEIWGPNQVLAAYSNDCTLRLFQAVPRNISAAGHSSQQEKSCRELVCHSIDPYSHTKKKSCFMEAMGLDEDVVGCLCSVSDDSCDTKTPHILVILSRDDLLVVDASSDTAGRTSDEPESLRVIDVEEAVLNYVLSLDHVDHRLLRLHDFLALGGDSDEVEFIVSQSMAACGYGRFMVEVAISIPMNADDENDNDDDNLGDGVLLLDRKLFLFSSSVGAIVWMGDSNPPNVPLPPRLEDMTLACIRRAIPGGGTRSSCTVAAVSHALAPLVMSCEIDHSGHIEGNFPLGSVEWSQTEVALEEGWNSRSEGKRPILVTPTDVVVGDSLTRQLDGAANREYKSTITFYSRFPDALQDGMDPISKLMVGENCIIDRMAAFRDDYVVMLVRFFTETGFAAVDGGGGHWGGENRVARVYALTIHVPSRREIERLCLYEDFGLNKLNLVVSDDTVACGAWLKGLIMTGADVRSVRPTSNSVLVMDEASTPKSAKKKGKHKRQSKGSGKKDGFARGMSLRG
ncbi:expressed unknown protein [Seminavis robusta]|uniref:F-box domain-containing protein n=1 Tax=Seminavis robusta TaxID=568900 RepID=A0A9N8DNI6_9STRA|nr:expressed unknown protein [Seminavis robusta]|eukprot:Sro236_g095130.1 n/a (984) ;mRNA; r:77729-80680